MQYEEGLAVMNVDIFEKEVEAERRALYRLIQEGIDDIENGRILTEQEILKNIETVLVK